MEIIIWILTILFILIGLITTVVGFPGSIVIWLGILINSWYYNFEKVSVLSIIILLIIAIISVFIDNLSVVVATKKGGSSNWGVVGAIVGALIGGLLFNVPGIILGAFAGAVSVEFMGIKKKFTTALASGTSAVIGLVIGFFLRFIFVFVMIFYWIVAMYI